MSICCDHNCWPWRSCILVWITYAMGGIFILENPQNSLIALHPRWIWMLERLRAHGVLVPWLHGDWWNFERHVRLVPVCMILKVEKMHNLGCSKSWFLPQVVHVFFHQFNMYNVNISMFDVFHCACFFFVWFGNQDSQSSILDAQVWIIIMEKNVGVGQHCSYWWVRHGSNDYHREEQFPSYHHPLHRQVWSNQVQRQFLAKALSEPLPLLRFFQS